MEHRTQIYLGEDHYRFLQERAEREGKSLAQLIRQFVEKEMPGDKAWEKDPLWKLGQSGFRSGVKEGSRRHHEILRESLKKNHLRATCPKAK